MTRDRRSRSLRRAATAVTALLLAFALAACTPPQHYPDDVTDVDLWERTDIRVDTEVPDQYPNGRVGGPLDEGHDAEEAGDDDH